MKRSKCFLYYISEIVIFAILLVLLSQGVQADTKGIVRPSDKYPLGAATMATFYAGENMVINTNYPTNGEFYAGHFYSGTSLSSDGKTELGPGSINDLSKYTGKLPNNLDPMFISPTAFSPAITKSLAETQSLRGNQGETYHYVMGATKADEFTDNQLNSIFNNNEYKTAFTNKAYKKSNGETAHLGDIDYFKDNGVVNQSSGIQNVTTVSDYYDNLTASIYDSEGNITGYKLAVFNDAIKSVTVNSQMVKDPIWTSPSLIQININMDETKTNTGVVAVDIDGKANNGIFQNAEEVSINLLNYDSSKQKIPYIILNYHNFNQFNFDNTSIFRVSAYTSEQVKRDKPDVNQFYLKDDRLNLSSTKDNAQRYNTASHIINNFNTITGGEDSTIQINNDKTDDGFSFLGTLLAPYTNISVNSTTTQGFAGNIVTGRSLYLLSDITADNAFSANFNSDGDFPGTSDLEPDANTPPRILSIDLPDNISFSPENATTQYKFEFSLNNNIQVDPESQTMHRLDGRKVKNTFNIEQPANSSSNLWSRMNDGQWKKYEKEAIAANDQDSAQTTQLSIADVTEDLKTADGKDNYDDQTLYDGGQIDASYDVDGQQKAFIGQHLLHRKKFSFIVARKEDDLSTMNQEEIDKKYSNTMAVYTLEVHGDLLVNYPKIFDFGTYQLGTSGLANNEFRVAKGQINVENPYYLDWKLLVKNTTTEIQNNPLLLDMATDFNARLYNLVSDTDDTWLPGAFVNLGSLKATGEQTMLVLSTEPDNSVDSNWTEVQPTSSMQFYKTYVELKFHTNRADGYVKRTGSYKLNTSWELTTPNIIKK